MNNEKNVSKIRQPDFQNNLWTFLAAGVFSIYITFIVLITTRWVGLAEAGIVSFAFAIASLFNTIILLYVRIFQASDVKQEYSLHSYLGLRVCSALVASVALTAFLLISRFDATRTVVILLFYAMLLTTGFADVFMGDLQQKGKMRVAGRMMVCAFGLNIVAFVITLFVSGSLIISLISSCAVTLVVFVAWIWLYQNDFGPIRVKYDLAAIKTLLRNVMPLFLAGIIVNFLYNMQKYYLGFLDSDESVAVITILLMPGTALQMLCASVFGGAEMTKTAKVYASGAIKKLSRRVNRQILLASAISIFFLLCVYTFGLPLLSWLFATDLSAYMQELIIVSIGGALFSVNIALSSAVIVMRMQKAHFVNILAVALVVVPLMLFIVARHGIIGAAFTNLAHLAPLTVVLFVIYRVGIRRVVAAAKQTDV